MQHKRFSSVSIVLWMAVLLVLGACGGTAPAGELDPAAIDASLSTNPSPPETGTTVELQAQFEDTSYAKRTKLTFDVRVDGEPRLVNGTRKGDAMFTGKFLFPGPGTYDVYLHIYVDDLHITKKKQVVVE